MCLARQPYKNVIARENLKILQSAVQLNNIDVDAATDNGVAVTHPGGYRQ